MHLLFFFSRFFGVSNLKLFIIIEINQTPSCKQHSWPTNELPPNPGAADLVPLSQILASPQSPGKVLGAFESI